MTIVKAPWSNETFEVLSRNRIEEVIRNLDPRKIVETAYAGYIPGMKSGYAAVNLLTGKLQTESLGQGEQHQGEDALWVGVFKIDQNGMEWQDEDIFDPAEIEKFKHSDEYDDGYGIFEYFDLTDEEYAKREIDALTHYFNLDWDWISAQLDEWYVGE